jgi:hypothetical protein
MCQRTKARMTTSRNPLQPLEITDNPWEIMSWDMVGPLPPSQGFDAVVVMVDTRTKAVKFEPANKEITAEGTGDVLKTRVFREEGLPQKIYSDHGPQFVGAAVKRLYESLAIDANPSTTYHPQMDRQTERVNQELGRYLRAFVNEEQDDWAEWLPPAEFAFNNAVNKSTSQTPFFLNHGRHPRRLPDKNPGNQERGLREAME